MQQVTIFGIGIAATDTGDMFDYGKDRANWGQQKAERPGFGASTNRLDIRFFAVVDATMR